MKKDTTRYQGSVDVNAPLMMIPCYNYGIDDLKAITKESAEEGLSLHSDGHVYFGGKRLSREQEKASYHLGSELPRFTTMFIIDVDKSEMGKIYQIWKALTTLNSYVVFDLGMGKVMIALHSPTGESMLEEMFHYHEYLLQKRLRVVKASDNSEDGETIKLLQISFDFQLYNEHEGCMMFPHKLIIEKKANSVIPISVHYKSDGLKYFKFDQIA